MGKTIRLLTLVGALCCAAPLHAQYCGVRVNALALFSGTLNAAVERDVGDRLTLDLSLYWNPLHTDRMQCRAVAVQPGIRYWFFENYVGWFLSGHLAAARYDIGNDRWHYKGWLAGAGLSGGYAWPLGRRWNLSAEGGLGALYMRDTQSPLSVGAFEPLVRYRCRRVSLGPSKCEVGFTYLF